MGRLQDRLGMVAAVVVLTACDKGVSAGAGGQPPDAAGAAAQSEDATRVVDFAIGIGMTCAALSTGSVHCHGMLPPMTGEAFPGFEDVVQVAIGGDGQVLCGRTKAGHVSCTTIGFGENRAAPAPVGIEDAIAILGRSGALCALHKTGDVSCWGKDFPLGKGGGAVVKVPKPVPGVAGAEALERGGYTTVCSVAGGKRTCWGKAPGRNAGGFGPEVIAAYEGARGIGGSSSTAIVDATGALAVADAPPSVDNARAMAGLPPARSVALGGFHGCAVTDDDGAVWCFPEGTDAPHRIKLANDRGQLGAGNTSETEVAVTTPLHGVTKLALETGRTCALTDKGQLWCWGQNELGELGPRGFVSATPVAVKLPAKATQLRADGSDTCALLANGAVWCWGGDKPMDLFDKREPARLKAPSAAQLGLGNVVCGLEGTQAWCYFMNGEVYPFDPGEVQDLTVGFSSACGRGKDGRVMCWGFREVKRDGGWTYVDTQPTPVGKVKADQLFRVGARVIVRTKNGALKEITASKEFKGAPYGVTNSTLPKGTTVAGGTYVFQCAQRGERTTCFTGREHEQSHDFKGHRFTQLAAGLGHACGVTDGKKLVCWGRSRNGETGFFEFAGEPREVPNLDNVEQVVAGPAHTCVLTTNGAVQCLGSGVHGQLGRPAATDLVLEPTQLTWR